MPRDSTKEKSSYLLYGLNLRTPTEAAFLSSTPHQLTDVSDYREELTLSLASVRELAAASIRKAQQNYKCSNGKKATKDLRFRIGDWVLVHFPAEETGKARKLSRPWHGPYRVVSVADPDVCASKVFFPQEGAIQVHQSRVKVCPPDFQGGFYWYGGKGPLPKHPPRWVTTMLEEVTTELEESSVSLDGTHQSIDLTSATSEHELEADPEHISLSEATASLEDVSQTERSEMDLTGLSGTLAISEVIPPKSTTPPPSCKYPCEIVRDELSGIRG